MSSLLFFLYVGYALIYQEVNPNPINFELMTAIRDDNHNTCIELSASISESWYTDICIPIYYENKTEAIIVELFGEIIGCSSRDDAKLFMFPVSTWEECTGLFGRRKTCHFNESSAVFGQQKCAYQCQYSATTVALRIIRLPYADTQRTWELCEASNIFYENPLCRFGPIGGEGGSEQDNRNCWIAAGRRFPTSFTFYISEYLRGIIVYYGDKYCSFGYVLPEYSKRSVAFMTNELITEVIFYRDIEKKFDNRVFFVGIKITTNYGNVYSAVDQGEEHIFRGEGLLYFHGRTGRKLDAVGGHFGKC